MATTLTLEDAVQGGRHTGQVITWTGQDLTNAAITGTKKNLDRGGEVSAIDGVLTVVTAASGIFSWAYGAGDVGTAGNFRVQFKATYPADSSKFDAIIESEWEVHELQSATVVAPPLVVGVTAEQAAFLDTVNVDDPEDGQVLTWDDTAGEWVNEDAAAGGLTEIVQDTNPQLGGDLDLNGHVITGLEIGTDVQAHDDGLDDIAGLAVTDGNFIVGNGTGWEAQSGATARTSLGAASAADLTSHTSNTSNPHNVTAAQVGALTQAAADLLYQPLDGDLTTLAALAHADGNFIVSDGAAWVVESGATARTSLGLGTLATQSGTFSGGGTFASGGFTLTAPATGTAALLATANAFTALQSVTLLNSGSITSNGNDILVLGINHTATPGTGFGGRILMKAESSVENDREVAELNWHWATHTHASRRGRLVLSAWDNVSRREGIRVETDGSAAMLGLYGVNAVARQTVTGSRGGNAALASLLTALAALGAIIDSSTA